MTQRNPKDNQSPSPSRQDRMAAFMRGLSGALSPGCGLDEMLEYLASSVAALTRSEFYLVAPYSPETGLLVPAVSSDPVVFASWSYRVADPQHPVEGALAESLADMCDGPILATALWDGGPQSESLGMIVLGRSVDTGSYDAADRVALDLVGAIAALAVARFRAHLESTRLAGDHALVARLAAHATTDGEGVLYQSAVDTAVAILGFSGCALFLVDPDLSHMTCVASRGGAPAEGARRLVPLENGPGSPRSLGATAMRLPEDRRHIVRPAGPGAFLMGVARPGRLFSDTDRNLFTTLAHSIGIMVDSALVAERERDRLRKTEMLLRLAHAVGSKTSLDATLEAAGVEARRMLGADCVSTFTVPIRIDTHQIARMSHCPSSGGCSCGHECGTKVPAEWVEQIDSSQPTVFGLRGKCRKTFGRHGSTVLVAPLHVEGAITGGIVFRWHLERSISDDTLDFAGTVAEIVALAVEKARLFEDLILEKKVMQVMNNELAQARDEITRKAFELKQMNERIEDKNHLLAEANERLEEMVDHDGMTGVANHRSFQGRLREEVSRASRHGGRLSLIMLDVDWFKRYNDDFGHPQGDDVLRLIAKTVSSSTRPFDVVARYGGEEFAVILPRTGRRAARDIAERIRANIEQTDCPNRQVTATLGVSSYPSDASSAEELVEHADSALYVGKARGRNQIVSWTKASSRLRRAA